MRIALAAAVVLTGAHAAHAYEPYTLDEANAFRAEWTEDNWDDGGPLTRYVFLNMTEFWRHSVIHRGGPVRPLPVRLRDDVAGFVTTTGQGEMALSDYVEASTVNGALVLHRGSIVFESYPRMRPTDQHLYMSVSKPFASTLIAILAGRGLIDVDEPLEKYLPQVRGSGWEGVSVQDVLDMTSGIGCLEHEEGVYDDPDKCYYQYEASLGWLKPTEATLDSAFDYVAGLPSHRAAGEAFEYTSVNTFVLGWLAEAVTGRPFADLVSTEIWQRMGAESDAVIVAPRNGVPIASGGLSSTLRDMARFGFLFTPSGRGKTVVSDAYLYDIQRGGRPEVYRAGRTPEQRLVDGEPASHNSWQWDFVMEDGDFFKGGYGGQGLYVSPSRDLVVAFFGMFEVDGTDHEMTRVARQLAKSGLFE